MERNAWCVSAEAGAIRNQVAERDAELCVDSAGARALVNDICAKPDSLGNVSRQRATWSNGTCCGASRGIVMLRVKRKGGHRGNAPENKLGVTTCRSIFQFLRIQYIKVHP